MIDAQEAALSERDRGQSTMPLVVDLDGTLIKSDSLHEAVVAFVALNPLSGPVRLAWWLTGGKANLKRRLADQKIVDPAAMIFNEPVVDYVRRAREQGRAIYLVSASDDRQVKAVAQHLDIFDEAVGSDGNRNLKGPSKAAYLVDRFGAGDFDYIGDATADIDVWRQANRAITVDASPRLRRQVDQLPVDAVHISTSDRSVRRQGMSYLRALRPHQWLKNTLVFAPPLAAHALDTLSAAFLAFVAFSLVASSVYVVNDLIDIESDRAHPRKRRRPFAAAEIPIHHGVIIAVSLALAALALSLAVGTWMFIGVLGLYYLTTFAYSFWLKRKLILDVWTLAGLYTIRVIAGAAATGVPLSLWFLAFSMFLFLALAAVKRHAELIDLSKRNGTHASGRAYTIEDMPFFPAMSIAAGYCAVLVFALYVSSPEVSVRYSLPYGLWLICPLLLYWISRIVLLTHRGDMHDDPIVFAVRDRVSLVIAAACGVLIAVSALS